MAAALWLIVLGLTGSTLVFYEEIDRALNPDLWRLAATPAAEGAPAADLVAAAEAVRPGAAAATYVDLPNRPGEPAEVYLAPRPGLAGAAAAAAAEAVPAGLHVLVDPADGRVLGERVFGAFRLDRRHFAHWLYQLHMDLHLGPRARWLLGLLALLWIVDHLPAAILSFPAPKKWRRSFAVRRGTTGSALVWALHRASGLWLLPITLTLAVSGLYFNWYDGFLATVDAVSPRTPHLDETAPVLPRPVERPRVSLDEAIAVARARAGGAEVDGVTFLPTQGLYWLRLFDERDLDVYGGRWIYVDMTSGAVRSDRHAAEGSWGDAAIAWQYPLHSGKAFGWPGRLLICAAGLAVSGLSATGLLIWARKRRQARRSQRLPEASPAAARRAA